jgi:6-phosphofructokinase 2
MIYTLALDATLEKTMEVDEFVYDDVNCVIDRKNVAGGKGFDISRVIRDLGGESVAFGFVGGYNGIEIEGRLANEGLVCDFTRINGETCERVTLLQRKKKTQTLLGTPSPQVTPFEVTTLLNKLSRIPKESYLVISGRIPPGIHDSLYAQIITLLREKQVKVFLDSDGEALKKGIKAGPYVVKPNVHEFGRLVEKSIGDYEDILPNVQPFLDFCGFVAVSMGAKGAFGVSREEAFALIPPKVQVKSSMGAGDALLGGLVFAMSDGMSFREALSFGVACGTASTLMLESGTLHVEEVQEIQRNLETKNVHFSCLDG